MGRGGGAGRHGDQGWRALRQSLLPDLQDRERQNSRNPGVPGLDLVRAGFGTVSRRAEACGLTPLVAPTESVVDKTENSIRKLVKTHGEEGVCPTADSWRE